MNDLTSFNINYLPEYSGMINEIKEFIPEMNRATKSFFKRQSQFMDNVLTVAHPTPIRNLRQILSEMQRTKQALRESHFKCKKMQVEIKILERKLSNEKDDLEAELIQIDIDDKLSILEETKQYTTGAIRKLRAFIDQYNSICKAKGVSNFTELDFEKEEERYHIMKAFDQAICSARSNHGIIDHGNFIYLNQIGVNGAVAQRYVSDLLKMESKMMEEGRSPGPTHTLSYINKVADILKGCSEHVVKSKGMDCLISEQAIIKELQ